MTALDSHYWSDYTSEAFSRLDRDRLIAVLPVGAIEQHGPHLPVCTDAAAIEAMVRATVAKLPADLPVLFLPVAAYGKSNEHARFPGTLTLSAATLISLWMDIGASVAASGVRKFVLFNSHGGQMAVMDIVARDLRVQHGMMTVAANWFTLGLPDGMFDEREVKHGVHAGDLETSIMLHIAPKQVRREQCKDFVSLTETMARENRYLSITPSGKLGWQMHDLNPEGAVGNAAIATAEKGAEVIDYVTSRFVDLLREIDRYPLQRLDNAPAWR